MATQELGTNQIRNVETHIRTNDIVFLVMMDCGKVTI